MPAPTQALLPARDAEAWAHAVAGQLVAEEIPAYAKPGQKGQWMLALSASLQGDTVVPRYALIDPSGADKGDVVGHPLPAADWARGTPEVLAQSAADAAPQVLALLRSVDASIKQSDPNSLYNRPARVYFSGVTGAPGDGNRALTLGMRTQLPQTGDQLVDAVAGADFTLRGTVKMTDEPSGEQQVEIHWLVSDARGVVVGDVAQGHDVAHGALDHLWGEVASVVTQEAAGGVHEVITNYSGRKKGV